MFFLCFFLFLFFNFSLTGAVFCFDIKGEKLFCSDLLTCWDNACFFLLFCLLIFKFYNQNRMPTLLPLICFNSIQMFQITCLKYRCLFHKLFRFESFTCFMAMLASVNTSAPVSILVSPYRN